ncbi:MAG: NAD(P)H-hydrate dehydratase, partial [Acidimicrobiia bacterium]|nr:NAD(P)H-hydrate dehydratase [Acidimicrobiia bacterium]
EEMAAVDAAAPEPVEVLIGRAGAAVARCARRMMGGTYGRRVVVVAGKGNNGNDGRAAATLLRRWGASVEVVDAGAAPGALAPCALVIDAAYGTGLRGEYHAPTPPSGARVLAVDIPSGYDGNTGAALGTPMRAHRTVTFAAPKPGLLLPPCRLAAGTIEVADIGLDVGRPAIGWVQDADVVGWVSRRPADHHKWRSAVAVVGGSSGMRGAARLAGRAAMRGGAGYALWLSLDGPPDTGAAVEVVGRAFDAVAFADDAARLDAVIVGPGLGRGVDARSALTTVLATTCPVVADADALWLLADLEQAATARRQAATILTPHDGEFARLTGSAPVTDRVAAARGLAADRGLVVLLKGPTTVVAGPDGTVRLVTSGTEALATAGTGDVLAGLIGAFLARGAGPLEAAAAAAHVHGRAGAVAGTTPVLAGDLPDRIGALLVRWGLG